jgi:hypothetical protein
VVGQVTRSGRARRLVLLGTLALCACSTDSCTIVRRWLEQSCGSGEAHALDAELRAAGARAEKDLIDAYRNGPGRLGDEMAAEAGRQHDEVIAALDAGRSYGLSAAEIAAVRSETREAHVREARDEYEQAYRRAALSGLAVVGRPEGLTLLRSVAADRSSPDRETAMVVLQQAARP